MIKKRKPIVTRTPVTLKDLRVPILIDDLSWYPIKGFENVYEITLSGEIRKTRTKKQIDTHNNIVILRHPDSNGNALCCNLCDVWSTTFLNDEALESYNYIDNIKRE